MVVEEKPKVETKSTYPSKDWLDRIKNEILSRIKEVDFNDTDMFDVDGFEFDIRYGNQIEVNSYNVDACSLKNYVENEIEEVFGVIEDDIIEIQKCNEELKKELERLNSNKED
jgi:hypothetical protein